ncbi:MAG: FecR family protein [Pedobacter sp.]|uniref:FecR family protein n=1 Tax=Pedobacter sp. TaxID=1411316 RepID=UPI002808A011|nr:FecR family protein [Pedobacter sp.]MDQ8004902.1 FecR family protein [Pedobacter sp.]
MEKNAAKLLKKYLSGQCTPEEKAIVEDWYVQFPYQRNSPSAEQIAASHEEVIGRLNLQKTKTFPFLKPLLVAASLLVCIGFGLIFFNRKADTPVVLAKKELKDVLPGGNKATLTLADGTVVDLDQALNGEISKQNGIIIRKTENGQLEYVVQDSPDAVSGTNTIATPRGGQYQVSLPDGTKVWLNAASSLKYPYPFDKNERLVELKGEAYFEVAKDQRRPFRVNTIHQTVEVLGTHFNVNAYADEPTLKTTLLEGSVKIEAGDNQVLLKPGQQAKLSTSNEQLVIDKSIDADQTIAWKNEVFAFNNEDIKSVMRQISRWYDIDVVYKGKITTEKYFGEIPRNTNLAEVFKILELNHIRVEVSGKTMTIIGD